LCSGSGKSKKKDSEKEVGRKQKWGVIHTLTLSSTAEQTFQPSQETERNRERERESRQQEPLDLHARTDVQGQGQS